MLELNVLHSSHRQHQEAEMTTEDQINQMMLERHERLVEAIEKAEAGRASEADWAIIRHECGVYRKPVVTLETVSIRSEE